jgi:hydroxypyruvate isomerase
LLFSVCTEMIYPRVRAEARTARVAESGFDRIDIWDWRTKDQGALERQLRAHGVVLNSFSGQTRSSTSIASEKGKFLEELKESIEFAGRFDCPRIIVYSERLIPPPPGSKSTVAPGARNGIAEDAKVTNIVDALTAGCDLAERSGVVLLLEALNNYDHPRYFLSGSAATLGIVRDVGRGSLKMLYDVYHMQVSEGNVTETLVENLDAIGFVHFADAPGRHEPGTGELNLPYILRRLDDRGYTGGVGFEYSPSGSDGAALKAIRAVTVPYT